MKEKTRLAKWLPHTDIQLLRLVVIGLATGCVWLAVVYFKGAIDGQLFLGLLTFVLWLPLAVGLWLELKRRVERIARLRGRHADGDEGR